MIQIGWQGHSCMVMRINDGERLFDSSSWCGAGRRFPSFVYRLARANTLAGWVLNGEKGSRFI